MTIEVPGYTILRELGRGGMATVYLAVQDSLNRQVALKVIAEHLAMRPNYRERFLREGRIAASFHHRHIVAIHDVATRGDIVYMAMEYLPRGAASAEIGRLSAADALRLVREIAGALDYAHGRGIVHRDVKPENILRHEDGAWLLSDFGVAHSEDIPSIVTRDGVTVGTPHYMSPEQWRSRTPDARADLYSLGVVMYQMLSGQLPYGGDDPWAIGLQHINDPVPKLPAPYERLQGLLDLLMAKELDRRVASGAEVVQRVQQLESDRPLVSTQPLESAPAAAPPRRASRRIALGAGAAVALAATAALGWYATRATPPAEPAPNASANAEQDAAVTARAVAVMPFRALDGGADATFFADGLADELITTLATVDGLSVAARASSFALRDSRHDPPTIGRLLRVGYMLEATVRRSPDRVHIGARLVDTAQGFNVWAQTFDRPLDDVFGVQQEIARAVAAAVTGAPAPDVDPRLAPPSRAVDAFEHYLRGRGLLDGGDEAGALVAFRAALATDPAYARAQAGICQAEIRRYTDRVDPSAKDRAERDCARARELDAELRDVDLAVGDLRRADGRYDDALAAYARAREDATLAPEALTGEAMAYAELGKHDDARRAYEDAIALQPSYWRIRFRYGNFLLGLGRHVEAIAIYRMALDLPGAARGRIFNNMGSAYMVGGDFDRAAEAYSTSLGEEATRSVLSNLGTMLFYLERFPQAAERFREALALAPDDYLVWGNLGDALTAQGDGAAAAAYERALDLAQGFLASNPNDAMALAAVAWYAVNLGRRDDAAARLAAALALDADNAEIQFFAALVHGRLGDALASRRAFDRATELGYSGRMVRSAARLYRLGGETLTSRAGDARG